MVDGFVERVHGLEEFGVHIQKDLRSVQKINQQSGKSPEPNVSLESGVSLLPEKIDHSNCGDKIDDGEDKRVALGSFAIGQAGADIPVGDPVFQKMDADGERNVQQRMGEFAGDQSPGGGVGDRKHTRYYIL